MSDWMSDPQREAYRRAMEDYDKFADIVHHWDETGTADHDDIPYKAETLEFWDGVDIGMVVANTGYISIVLNSLEEALEQYGSWEEIPDDYDFGGDDREPYDYDGGNPTGWICDKCRQEDDDAGT